MFSKMTKGELTALMAILKMNTARSSWESLSGIGKPRYESEPQLNDVVLIVVLFMFSVCRVFRLVVLVCEIRSLRVDSLTANLFVFQRNTLSTRICICMPMMSKLLFDLLKLGINVKFKY